MVIRIVAAVQAFGKAGSAALKEEADSLRPAKKARTAETMQLKTQQGLYAGPSVDQRRWVSLL